MLAIETKSLLLGESASVEAERPDRRRPAQAPTGIDRIVHLKTMHLGPDELLVAAKIAVHRRRPPPPRSPTPSTTAEASIRSAEPIARVIYLEPEIVAAD